MKTFLLQTLAVTCTILVLGVGTAGAITMTVNRTTAMVGEPVTVTLTGTAVPMGGPANGSLQINFGDGSPIRSMTSTGSLTLVHTATHTYASSGTYTITGTGIDGFSPWQPPLTASQSITITSPPDMVTPTLPRGEVGSAYETRLQSVAGSRGNIFQLVRGNTPPGLQLDRTGLIRGIPTRQGGFPFTVRITTAQGVTSTQNLIIHIDPGKLVIETTPQRINVTAGAPTRQQVSFRVAYPTVSINETVRSMRGEFLAGGQLLGTSNNPLSINLSTVNPSVTEMLAIPPQILQKAQQAGTNIITYRRTFSCQNLRQGSGETTIMVQTAAAGELRITGMRLFFEQNNRPLILVERNERNLTGVADIHFNGSGTFKGYWQVDERIIQRIQQNVFYGKTLTLKTPPVPPLPTYSEGAHRLRFIITEPVSALERIDFPEAIYHVEAKQAEIVVPITLTQPQNGSSINTSETTFNWSEVPGVTTYLLEFFDRDGGEPFFTAYTRSGSYLLAEKIIELKFKAATSYHWRVRGFNRDGELAAQSAVFSFTLTEQAAFVPGQVIFLVDNNDKGRALIHTITEKHGLRILEQTELQSVQRIMILCSTDAEVRQLATQIQQQESVPTQPNFIFTTMGEDDPLRSLQSIHRLIDLERIQQRSSGKNVMVAIIDTGVDLAHQDLQGRIKAFDNFVTDSVYRGELHGTAVAGIIAAARNKFGIRGIAPEAELFAWRACEQISASAATGRCFSTSIAKALDAAITARVDIVNLSLGSGQEDQLTAEMIEKGHDHGIIFIAPVGNDPLVRQPAFPASHPRVTAVAGFDITTNNPFPNQTLASAADAVAPSQHIFSLVPGNKHNYFDGTSYSAAIISGIAALSIELNGTPPATFPRFDETMPWGDQVAASVGL